MFVCPPGAVVLAGQSLAVVAQAVREAQRWRARNGLPPLRAYSSVLASIAPAAELTGVAAGDLVAADGHADSLRTPAGHDETMTTDQAAEYLGASPRTVRRLAPALGGRRVGRAWLLDAAAVAEHRGGMTA